MTIDDIIETIYGCYENYVSISYGSLINTFKLHDMPFTINVYEIITEIITPYERYPHKASQCAVDIELYNEGSRITITMVNDYITNITRESSMTNMFNDCRTLDNLTFYCNY